MGALPIYVRPIPALAGLPQPIPYQGSKRLLAHAIVRLIPSDVDCLREPFAGSAAVSMAARKLRLAPQVAINDVNEPLMELWRCILADPAAVACRYRELWTAQLDDPRAFYDLARSDFNRTREPVLLLYLLARCVKASVRYSKRGDFNQSADHRRLGARPEVVQDRLLTAASLLQGATVTSSDYAEQLLAAGPGDVVYMDPPYQGVSNVRDHRYMRGLAREDFEEVLERAVKSGLSFIISYDMVTDDAQYGEALASHLGLRHLHLAAGLSSQATLHGERKQTIESLYLSPALVSRLGGEAMLAATVAAAPRSARKDG